MATSDKFIQSMVELLDKLIENQSKNATLLSEIKFSLSEIRDEQDSILTSVREKLPEHITREQEDYFNKLSSITSKIENANSRLAENIRTFEQDYVYIKTNIDKNSKTLEEYSVLLLDLKKTIEEKDSEKEELKTTIKEVKSVIDALKSKKAWVALIVAGVAALATMASAIFGGIESMNKAKASQPTPQTSPSNPPSNPPNP